MIKLESNNLQYYSPYPPEHIMIDNLEYRLYFTDSLGRFLIYQVKHIRKRKWHYEVWKVSYTKVGFRIPKPDDYCIDWWLAWDNEELKQILTHDFKINKLEGIYNKNKI